MTGRVVLVGGGPGAADLITVRGLERLRAADVVVTDRLAPSGLLDGLRAEIVDASRGPDSRTLSHEQIVAVLVGRARAGDTVVRLKGGDPFVLAHGPQEVAACIAAGVPVEVVPGVSSALAAPALAGVALTEVGGAAGFTVVSGHADPSDPECPVDWTALASTGTTLVVLMGMRRLALIVDRLLADGLPASTAAACIADASLPSQRSVRCALADLPSRVSAAGLTNPAVVVISPGHPVPGDSDPAPLLCSPGARICAHTVSRAKVPDTAPRRTDAARILVLGGSRSGKSAFAESLLADDAEVDYLATAADRPDDLEWRDRVRRHRERRPAIWRTVETGDAADVAVELGVDFGANGAPALLDSVTTWLARAMDDAGCWDDPPGDVTPAVDAFVAAWRATERHVVAVSDEVGSGVVPATAAGRRFRDELGLLNQRLAAEADEVYLVTAGIARRLA